MTADFEPIGDLARHRVLIEIFRLVQRGSTVTYLELGDALGLDPVADIGKIRAAVYAASKTLSVEHDRSLSAVRGVGYRVVYPNEHLDLAGRQQRKSRRALQRAKNHVEHVDMSDMAEDVRKSIIAAARILGYQQAQIRRLDLRQRDLERVVESITVKTDRTDREHSHRLSVLEARLAALETPTGT